VIALRALPEERIRALIRTTGCSELPKYPHPRTCFHTGSTVISYHDIRKVDSCFGDGGRAANYLVRFAGVAAIRFYYVEEMLALLVLFAVLFSCVSVVLLLLFILRAWAGGRFVPPLTAAAFAAVTEESNDPDGMKEMESAQMRM
jgi:hypothetical protein